MFKNVDEAIEVVNNTDYGLQAGVFPRDYASAMRCAQEIETGTVFINKQSTFRTDNMLLEDLKIVVLAKKE